MDKIINARDKKVSELNSGLPDVIAAIATLLQDVSAVYVQKQQIDGYTQEVPICVQTKACIQPMGDEQLKILPEGQRSWKYFYVWSLKNFDLATDEIFWIKSKGYRILDKTNWNDYGYIQYSCIEDYTDAPNITNNG
jgi:hypothetical protein